MTFDEFQATARDVPDLAKVIPDEMWDDSNCHAPGRVYLDRLWIEKVTERWSPAMRTKGGWYLMIGNLEWISDDLAKLERELYDFAVSSGYADGEAA